MIVLRGSYSRSWCQSEIDNIVHPPRGVNTTDTTVLVPINMIKVANTKIIESSGTGKRGVLAGSTSFS